VPAETEDRVWESLMWSVQDERREDREEIERGERVIPTLYAYSYCWKCEKITPPMWLEIDIPMGEWRRTFRDALMMVLHRARWCPNCQSAIWTVPVAYAFTHVAWIATPPEEIREKPEEVKKWEEEFMRYLRTFGTIEGHPDSKEHLVTWVMTTLRRGCFITAEITREPVIRVGPDRKYPIEEMARFLGAFIVELPRLKVDP